MARPRRRPLYGTIRSSSSGIPGTTPRPVPPRVPRPLAIVRPPAGLYDPALDAAEGQTQRGLGDYKADYIRDFGDTGAGGRRRTDYEIGVADVTRNRDEGLADLATSETRGRENYQGSLASLARDFQRLATRQAEGARSRGILSGGLAQLAASRRAENESFARQPIEQGFQRFTQDLGRDRTRLTEGTDRGLAALALGYGRDATDAATGLTRAEREAAQFGIDTQASRLHSATQLGYVPPRRRRRGGRR